MASTNFGLSRFNPEFETFRNYRTSDGLQSNEFSMSAFAKSVDERFYFGGVDGLNAFTPAEIKDSSYIPPVVLTSVTHGGNSNLEQSLIKQLDEITLSWPNNNFSFEFAALSYAQPDHNQYAYILENFDSNWNSIDTHRDGRYTNLPGGTYTLRIKGMYPMALKEKGLATTLREYVFEWKNRNGIMISLDIQNAHRMDLENEQAIYRMIQEALANVARHSKSDQVEVSLVYNNDTVDVTVHDNGIGFDADRRSGGMGLRIIKERAESIGGQACIESEPNFGTKVSITIPFNGHV